MKTTLIVIQSDADHAQAKALVGKLMASNDSADQARMVAQARLIEAYERARWPRQAPTLPELLGYLMDQHGLTPHRSGAPARHGKPCQRGLERQARA